MNENTLDDLLHSIPDSYPDFVTGITISAKKSGLVDEIIQFINHNPTAMTDDVINHLTLLEGNPEPLQIVDD